MTWPGGNQTGPIVPGGDGGPTSSSSTHSKVPSAISATIAGISLLRSLSSCLSFPPPLPSFAGSPKGGAAGGGGGGGDDPGGFHFICSAFFLTAHALHLGPVRSMTEMAELTHQLREMQVGGVGDVGRGGGQREEQQQQHQGIMAMHQLPSARCARL